MHTIAPPRHDVSLLTDQDLYLFNEGSHYRLYEKLGAHLVNTNGGQGTYFAVWAPPAPEVFVMGDFNGWDHPAHPLQARGSSGSWGASFTKSRRARRQWSGTLDMSGTIRSGSADAASGTRSMHRRPFMKSTWGPGCAP